MLLGIEKEKQTNDYMGMFDLIKGFFMILIIIGHSVTDSYQYWKYDYSFDAVTGLLMNSTSIFRYGFIPMFFMICGYSFRRKSVKTCIRRQIRPFIKPYLWVAGSVTICAVLKKVLMGRSVLEGVRFQTLPYLLGYCPGEREFLGIYMDSIGPIWFVFVYVFAGILLNFVLQEKSEGLQYILISMLGVLGILMKNITLPFCIQQTMICCGYMFIGMKMKKNKFLYQKQPTYIWIFSFVFCFIGGLFGGNIEVSQNVWYNGTSDLIISYVAGIFLLYFIFKLNGLCGEFMEKIRWMGRYAMWICCIHTVTYTVIPWQKLLSLTGMNMMGNIVIEFIVSTVIALGVCKGIEIRMKKIRRRI